MIDYFLPMFVNYLSYLGCGLVMLWGFAMLYAEITPFDELALIRDGAVAAALSYGGALLGFSLTLASSAIHANKLELFLAWSLLAGLVQIAAYFVLARCFKGLAQALIENNIALGALSGSVSLAVGVLNAACLS